MLSDRSKIELAKPLDRAAVKGRKQGGMQVSYIEGWHAIAEANRIFGFDGWSRETVDIKCVSEKQRDIGQAKNAGWGVTYVCKVRVMASDVLREGCGSGHGIDRDLGQAHESAIKEAETDAMKRALMTFGSPFGLALYDKSQADVVERMTKKEARPSYLSMLKELDDLETARHLQEWLVDNATAMKPLPDDWQDSLRRVVEMKITSIRSGREVPKSAEILSEDWSEKQGANIINAVTETLPIEHTELWTDGDTPPEWSQKWDALGPVKQAGVLCNEPAFGLFLKHIFPNGGHPAELVREHCGVSSRKELATNPEAAKMWRVLVQEYRAWQREPEIVPATSHPATQAAAPSQMPPQPGDGATDELNDDIMAWDSRLATAALQGMASLSDEWGRVPSHLKKYLLAAKDRRHKVTAQQVAT
jgi:DNA recombination protein Rad52